jgi:hypothetical protein
VCVCDEFATKPRLQDFTCVRDSNRDRLTRGLQEVVAVDSLKKE